jgi:hypothetical protein
MKGASIVSEDRNSAEYILKELARMRRVLGTPTFLNYIVKELNESYQGVRILLGKRRAS